MYGDLVAKIKKMQAKMLLMHETENAKDLINWIQTSKKHFFFAIKLFIMIKPNARMGPIKDTADSDACPKFGDFLYLGWSGVNYKSEPI